MLLHFPCYCVAWPWGQKLESLLWLSCIRSISVIEFIYLGPKRGCMKYLMNSRNYLASLHLFLGHDNYLKQLIKNCRILSYVKYRGPILHVTSQALGSNDSNLNNQRRVFKFCRSLTRSSDTLFIKLRLYSKIFWCFY